MLPSLQTLNIKYCDAVSEEGLYHLRRCKHLLYLDLSGLSCVSDAVLDQLHGMQPEDLIMDDRYQIGNVTDDGITRFVLACTSLSRLDGQFRGAARGRGHSRPAAHAANKSARLTRRHPQSERISAGQTTAVAVFGPASSDLLIEGGTPHPQHNRSQTFAGCDRLGKQALCELLVLTR